MPNKSRTKCLWEESEAATELQERVTSTQTLAAQVVPMLLTTLLMSEGVKEQVRVVTIHSHSRSPTHTLRTLQTSGGSRPVWGRLFC